MQPLNNHIVLIGFKHTGKSVIGESLAKKLHVPFIDLDQKIEFLYENKFNKKCTCRQIMQQNGKQFFHCCWPSSVTPNIGYLHPKRNST